MAEIQNEAVFTKAVCGPLRQIVQCTGPVYSNLDVDIKCRASGEIKELPRPRTGGACRRPGNGFG